MLLTLIELVGAYNRVHPNVAGLYFGKILHINLLSIFVVVAGVPSQIPMSTFSVVPILRVNSGLKMQDYGG